MSNRLDSRRRVRSVSSQPSVKSRRAGFASASRSRQARLEQLEARLALAADLEEMLGGIAERLPTPRPESEPVQLPGRSGTAVTRTIVPGEIILAMEGNVALESVRDQLQKSLQLSQIDTNGSIQLEHLLTSAPNADSPTTLFCLELGEF